MKRARFLVIAGAALLAAGALVVAGAFAARRALAPDRMHEVLVASGVAAAPTRFEQSPFGRDGRAFWGETTLAPSDAARLAAHAGLRPSVPPAVEAHLRTIERLSGGEWTAAALASWQLSESPRRFAALASPDGSQLEYLFVALDPATGRVVFLGEYAYG